jgi:glyoxylase-like metal-dependent hydrolase (beta-lactamase superfamily II)
MLVESSIGLILVDTGLGTADLERPTVGRLGISAWLMRPRPDPDEAALRQVERLGFSSAEVSHLVPTHLDLDHAGGLPDFPHAQVHVHRWELEAAQAPRGPIEGSRYRAVHWAHGPAWIPYDDSGETWFGFEGVRELAPEVQGDILLVPLRGHTRGHTGVAVNTHDGWLFHAGDAYFDARQLETPPRCSPGLRAFQWVTATDRSAGRQNVERLRGLSHRHPEVRVFCSHDPTELERLSGGSVKPPLG